MTQDERFREHRHTDRQRERDEDGVADGDPERTVERRAFDRGERREQHAARDHRQADDQQLGKPEGERVEPERGRAEHAADEHVVDLADQRGEDVDRGQGAAEPQHPRDLRPARAAGRPPRHQPPQRRRQHRGSRQVAEDEAPCAEAGEGERDAGGAPGEQAEQLGEGARAEVHLLLRQGVVRGAERAQQEVQTEHGEQRQQLRLVEEARGQRRERRGERAQRHPEADGQREHGVGPLAQLLRGGDHERGAEPEVGERVQQRDEDQREGDDAERRGREDPGEDRGRDEHERLPADIGPVRPRRAAQRARAEAGRAGAHGRRSPLCARRTARTAGRSTALSRHGGRCTEPAGRPCRRSSARVRRTS